MVTESEYFKDILIWDEKNPDANFAICKDISPIPVVRLESWRHFQQFIEKRYDDKLGRDLIFRGQRHYDWKLISSLGRTKSSNFIHDLEKQQLDNFRQAIRGRIQDYSLLTKNETDDKGKENDNDNELWSIGQHHGLMTPLLDWTHSPHVALFFAFIEEDTIEESLMSNYYRAVYILDSIYFSEFIKDSDIGIFEPTQDEHGRLVNQDGLFTISPIDVDIETEIYNSLHKYLKKESRSTSTSNMAKIACKVYIKNIDREECLQNLDYMNINHKSLFPDLHGSAYFCNSQMENFGYNFQKASMNEGSLMFVLIEEIKKCKKNKLYYEIEKILTKILNKSLSKSEKIERDKSDEAIKAVFTRKPSENYSLVPQIEILTREITWQIQRLEKLPIPSYSYEALMRTKLNLVLTKFNLKGVKPIQAEKQQVIDKIIGIIKNDEE